MARKQSKQLSGRRRLLAKYAAQRLLATLAEDSEVIEALVQEFNCPVSVAEAVVAEAWREIIQADDGYSESEKKGIMLSITREFYRRTLEEKAYAPALGAIRHMSRLFGVDRAREERDKVPDGSGTVDEFSGRSAGDLRFYADHGCFPEEHKAPKKRPGKHDPLAGLH